MLLYRSAASSRQNQKLSTPLLHQSAATKHPQPPQKTMGFLPWHLQQSWQRIAPRPREQ
jgi:hypothetical protein